MKIISLILKLIDITIGLIILLIRLGEIVVGSL